MAEHQTLKGADKYEEPFNPDSWSGDQLADHAMQELVDAERYVTGMRDRMRKLERELKEARTHNQYQEAVIKNLRGQLEAVTRDRTSLQG